MVGGGGRIWTDTAPIKRRSARPYLSELGCHGRSMRGAHAASQLCTPGGDWRGGPTPHIRSGGGGCITLHTTEQDFHTDSWVSGQRLSVPLTSVCRKPKSRRAPGVTSSVPHCRPRNRPTNGGQSVCCEAVQCGTLGVTRGARRALGFWHTLVHGMECAEPEAQISI